MTSPFSAELQAIITKLLTRFETKRSSILPILHAVQDEKDWISPGDVLALEAEFGLSAIDINEVLTFYSMYRKSPPEPWRLEICNSISCWLNGSAQSIAKAQKHIADAKAAGKPLPVECHPVECLGVCGYAPVALMNKDRHLNVTPELAIKLIEEYAAKETPAAAKVCAAQLKNAVAHP